VGGGGGGGGGTSLRAAVLLVLSATVALTVVSANENTQQAVSDSRLGLQGAASVDTQLDQDEKRGNSFRSDFGKRVPDFIDREKERDLLGNYDVTGQRVEEKAEEGSLGSLAKRLSRFRSDFGKRKYRADLGKRRFRADFGKRSEESDEKEEEQKEEEEEEKEGGNKVDVEMEETPEKRAKFRADLGKRAIRVELLGRPGRRFYRADLGKRRYRSDFG